MVKNKKENKKDKSEAEDKFSLQLHLTPVSLKKLQYIAYYNRLKIKDVVKIAFQSYIRRYEEKFGTLKIAPKKTPILE